MGCLERLAVSRRRGHRDPERRSILPRSPSWAAGVLGLGAAADSLGRWAEGVLSRPVCVSSREVERLLSPLLPSTRW